MASSQSLLDALPPKTDYITYLTIIEYNLEPKTLATLYDILQDETLTANIGWDLVALLVPLLPASEQCLQTIARLGNPREVILKVTECLRSLPQRIEDAHDNENEDEDDDHVGAQASTSPVSREVSREAVQVTAQYISLTSMLGILHPRIQTRFPSRFLSSSLQALLPALSSLQHDRPLAVKSTIDLLKVCHNAFVLQASQPDGNDVPSRVAADPEADICDGPRAESEVALQCRLLQSFLSHIFADYVLKLRSVSDIPSLAWSIRLQEAFAPERLVKGKKSMTERFAADPASIDRSQLVDEMLDLVETLGLSADELLVAATAPQVVEVDLADSEQEEDSPPEESKDVPLSDVGALLLYTAKAFRQALGKDVSEHKRVRIWPEHRDILHAYTIGSDAHSTDVEVIADSVLALATIAVEHNQIGEPTNSEDFGRYLQGLSYIASNCPSPSLRYQAYYLTTIILRSNPSDLERLSFIKDTLEHCPFDNLKVAAVSWIKGEIIEANPSSCNATYAHNTEHNHAIPTMTVFQTPVCLETLGPFLFPDFSVDLADDDVVMSWHTFDKNASFTLAVLNFYILLRSAPYLQAPLHLAAFHEQQHISKRFLTPLELAVKRYRAAAATDEALGKAWVENQSREEHLGQLKLVEYTLDRLMHVLAR